MASAADDSARSANPGVSGAGGVRGPRGARLVRAGALLVIGFGIAFSATLHEDPEFVRWSLVSSLALIGLATAAEYWVLRGTAESWWIAARAVIALAAAGSLFAVVDTLGAALVLALWAVLTAVVTAMRLARRVQPARVAVPSLLLSLALAVSVLLVRDDPVAIIGFFGAYAVIRGIFLGISAFDPRNALESADDGRLETAPNGSAPPRIESES